MKLPLSLLLSCLMLLLACEAPTEKADEKAKVFRNDSLQSADEEPEVVNQEAVKDSISKAIPKNIKPVFGYRFKISGDFDGDGNKENLTEHYVSGIDGKETNKLYEGLTAFSQLVELVDRKKPISFVRSDNPRIDTLPISSNGQLLGLSYLKNEGDLNGDGTDEVSYVIDCADRSNLNTWHIVTYKDRQWKPLYSFSIRDYQLPDLPQTFNQHGPFGLEDKVVNTTNKKVNKQLERELLKFKGLVKKVGTNKIRITGYDDYGEDLNITVDLTKVKQ